MDIKPGTLAAPLTTRCSEGDMIFQDGPEMTGFSRTKADMGLPVVHEDEHLEP